MIVKQTAVTGPTSGVHIEIRWSTRHHHRNSPTRPGPSATARPFARSMLPNQRSISTLDARKKLRDGGCSIVTTRTSGT